MVLYTIIEKTTKQVYSQLALIRIDEIADVKYETYQSYVDQSKYYTFESNKIDKRKYHKNIS